MIQRIELSGVSVWFTIDRLRTYAPGNMERLIEHDEYLCYFKFAEPSHISGELLRDPQNRRLPVLFETPEAAIEYATNYVRQVYAL